jgi:hypothetical protein
MPFKKLTSKGKTVIRQKLTSPKAVGGFYSLPEECDVRSGGSVQLRACVGAVCGGAACGRARYNAVGEEMMQPLDSVRVELCKDAGGVVLFR